MIGVKDDTYINQDVFICPGEYVVEDVSGDGVLVFNATGVALDCQSAPISGTDSGYGIYSNDYDQIAVKNCNIRDYRYGLSFWYVDKSSIENATFASNGYGLYLQSSHNNTLSRITSAQNYNSGLYLSSSRNNTLSSLNASQNSNYGIYLSSSDSNTLSSLNASQNSYYGVYLYYSRSNTNQSSTFNNTASASAYD
ncbi:MAG: right-handed parallel beta-helix repeat-containing protein, partial [Candidatus Aenigmarchaeota archaeon]|nr:right-handed parallel beta-helix repeat-containing protein [Candidatus Aenigmarchaeota archaeon]